MSHHVIEQTQKWLEDIIIGHNFCPFAKREYVHESIRFKRFDYAEPTPTETRDRFAHLNTKSKRARPLVENFIEQAITLLMREIDYLDNQSEVETTLIIFDKHFGDFEQFLDLVDVANHLVEESGYLGIYQLATFHPNYLFEGEAPSDASHYTNRSPYPMLHLLREASVEKALSQYQQPENIPQQNIEKARDLGSHYFRQYLNSLNAD